jgi:hypothetical protein
MAPKLLDEVLEAHGGVARWERVRELRVRVRCGGWALAARFQRGAYRAYEAVVDARRPQVRFVPFKGGEGIFTPGRVAVETPAGAVRDQRANPRQAFPSLRRHLVWDALDVLYFGGYAMWNYLTTPFLLRLPGVEAREAGGWEEGGERWRRLAVSFPAGFPTHCAEQVFYVDGEGRVRRHDYTAEVIGPYARAVHYSDDHRWTEGLLFPRRRRVYPRRGDGRSLGFPTLIWIDIDELAVVGG